MSPGSEQVPGDALNLVLPNHIPDDGDCVISVDGAEQGDKPAFQQKVVSEPEFDENRVKWSQHPNSTKGIPTIVKTSIYLYHIGEVNTVEGTVYIEIHLQTNWIDPRLAVWKGEEELPPNIWTPHARVREQKEVSYDVLELRRLDVYSAEGQCQQFEVTKVTCFRGKVYNRMTKLQLFPYDFDTVVLTFDGGYSVAGIEGKLNRCLKNSHRLVVQVWDNVPDVNIRYDDNFMENGEWSALAAQVDYYDTDGTAYDLLQVSISLSRSPTFHLNTVVGPLALLSLFNILGHALPVMELPDRLTYQGTLLVAVMALLFLVHDDLPDTTKVTIVDKLINWNLTLMAVSGVQCVVEDAIHRGNADDGGGDDTSTFPDWYAWLIMGIYFLIYAVIYGVLLLKGVLARKNNIQEVLKKAGKFEKNPKLIPGMAWADRLKRKEKCSLLDHIKKIEKDPGEYTVPGWLRRGRMPQKVANTGAPSADGQLQVQQ